MREIAPGSDVLYAGDGDDELIGGGGWDLHSGQSGNDRLLARDGQMSDDRGNKYAVSVFTPRGGIRSESIYPDKTIEDILLFERPVDTVKELTITLSREKVGSKGFVRFRIPMSAVKKAA